MKRILCNSIRYYATLPGKTMSRPRLLATELYKKRVEQRARDKSNLILNNADLHVIGCDSQGFYPSLLVNSEGNSYLFNCYEGTQRFCYGNKIKITNIENIFITNPSNWRSAAGAYGLSLTLQDVGIPMLKIHATEQYHGFFDNTASFISYNTGMQCSIVDRTKERLFEDKGLKIQTIVIDCEKKFEDQTKRLKIENPRLLAYLCTLPDLPGPLDPKKCRELKVPIGPLLAVLKSGKDVTLDNGRVIKSSDVCGSKTIGLSFLIVDCPSEEHIPHLIECNDLDTIKSQRKTDDQLQIEIVVHFAPSEVTRNPLYQKWMQGFGNTCRHLLLSNPDSDSINFEDCYRLQYLMRKLDNEMFPELYLPKNKLDEVNKQIDKKEEPTTLVKKEDFGEDDVILKTDSIESLDKVVKVNSLDRFFLRPNTFIETVDFRLPMDDLHEQAKEHIEFEKRLKELRKLQSTLPAYQEHEPEVVFLGTGSALPAKLRNTSCILVNFHHKNFSAILDCGEDSYGQLYRHYGPEKIIQFFRQLKLIYISHHHADHHIGLISLLRERKRYTNEQIALLAPPNIEILLNYHNREFDDISDTYELYSTKRLMTKPTGEPDLLQANSIKEYKLDLYKRLNSFLNEITIVPVQHCINSCAVVMKFVIGHKDMETFTLSYSGDARPSEDFVIAGKKSDLLIHEATFDHRSTQDAISKKHSTSTEAIEVAKKMEAKYVLLTHFSQRLAKIPFFTEEFDDTVGFAFDNLCLRYPSQLIRLPIMKSILSVTFEKSLAEINMKYYKQEAKKNTLKEILKLSQSS